MLTPNNLTEFCYDKVTVTEDHVFYRVLPPCSPPLTLTTIYSTVYSTIY